MRVGRCWIVVRRGDKRKKEEYTFEYLGPSGSKETLCKENCLWWDEPLSSDVPDGWDKRQLALVVMP